MTSKIAVFAAGCFWGVEELIRKVKGVVDTEVGYTGGQSENPTYETVKTGRTGHAEAIQVSYDPAQISYEQLLKLFFQLHDPTTLNRQGGDVGTQYRSAIFYGDEAERLIAERVKRLEDESGRWPRPVTTTLEPLNAFYSAEGYHQDYLQRNPGGYTCHFWRGSGPQ
jgi:methionine-S-sulfoxide reductase